MLPAAVTVLTTAGASQNYITQDQLAAQLQQATNALRSLIYQQVSAPNSPLASGGALNNIAVSQRIDQLANVTASNLTVHGVSGLTAADIPTGITASNYLPLIGGTLSGVLTAPYFVATSTTATSTFAGGIIGPNNFTIQQGSGNVGIGTTSPTNRLEVAGNTFLGGTVTLSGTQTIAPPVGATVLSAIGPPQAGGTLSMLTTNISAMDPSPTAVLWQQGIGIFPNANLPDTNANNVMSMGWNVAAGGGLIDPTKGGIRIGMESNYSDNGTTAHEATEFHIANMPAQPFSGEQRIFSSNARHDGSLISTSMMADVISLSDRAGVVPFQFNITNRNLSMAASSQITFGTNNVVTIQQRNAAGDAFIPLPYYVTDNGSDNRLSLPAALRAIGATPTTGDFANIFAHFQATSLATNGVLISGTIVASGGTVNAFKISGNPAGGLIGELSNTTTGRSDADAAITLRTTSTGGGNYIRYANGSTDWYAGLSRSLSKWTVGTNTPGNSDLLQVDTSGNVLAKGTLALTGTTGTSTIAAGQGFTIGGSQFVVQQGSGNVGIGTTTPWRKLGVTGTVGFDGLTGSVGAGSLCLSANKEVVYNSGSDSCLSSLRATKHDINNLSVDGLSLVSALAPVSFVYNNDASSTVRYGFIAEDAAVVDTHFATHDATGAISGVDDRGLLSVVIKALQELIGQVQTLTSTVSGFALNIVSAHVTADMGDFKEVTTDKLCVGSVCVTQAQFEAVFGGGVGTTSSSSGSVSTTPDTTPPVITINGANPAQLHVGDTYSDLGATVTDNVDTNLGVHAFVGSTPLEQATIDTSTTTTYHIDYVATDSAGNTATSTRTVIVGN